MLFDKFDNKTIINGVITAVDPLLRAKISHPV